MACLSPQCKVAGLWEGAVLPPTCLATSGDMILGVWAVTLVKWAGGRTGYTGCALASATLCGSYATTTGGASLLVGERTSAACTWHDGFFVHWVQIGDGLVRWRSRRGCGRGLAFACLGLVVV